MADAPTPDEIARLEFKTARRGYDRDAVDEFKRAVADRIRTLSERVERLERDLEAAGNPEVKDLEQEFAAVAAEVGSILQAAREAAAQMRSRAAADAARWRAEADESSRTLRREATADAETARQAAWETGTEMLEQAVNEAAGIMQAAEQDALFIRAEAEREALRLTADARRDREDEVRAARVQAERMLLDARAESESILETARQSAEAAQERARALELRRAELMEELESARRSIGQLEQEIDTRREALHYHGVAEPSGMRVLSGEPDQPEGAEPHVQYGAEWLDEDMAVRVVPAVRVHEPEPVDADAFVAEVMEMRTQRAAPQREEPLPEAPPAPPVHDEEAEESAEPVATTSEPPPTEAEARVVEAEPEAVEPPEPEPASSEPEEPSSALREVAEPEAPQPRSDELTSLFRKLRAPTAAPPPESAAPPQEPVTETVAPPLEAAPAEEAPAPAQPQPEPVAGEAGTDIDPFELRDRLLIPIENRALRSVKRRLVDLQNRVLEDVRVSGEAWQPDKTMLAAAFDDDVARLAQEALVAGYAGAAELVGADATPQPEGDRLPDATGGLVAALAAAVDEASSRARDGGAGSRQLSAAVSRVFRAWRTDEAERRLRRLCYTAYHEGLIRAFPAVGVAMVMGTAPGHPCGECPAGTGTSWAPGGPLPAGRAMPPAVPGCRCTIVPAGA